MSSSIIPSPSTLQSAQQTVNRKSSVTIKMPLPSTVRQRAAMSVVRLLTYLTILVAKSGGILRSVSRTTEDSVVSESSKNVPASTSLSAENEVREQIAKQFERDSRFAWGMQDIADKIRQEAKDSKKYYDLAVEAAGPGAARNAMSEEDRPGDGTDYKSLYERWSKNAS